MKVILTPSPFCLPSGRVPLQKTDDLQHYKEEIEVLKEMVKSANMQAKSKDIDVSRLQKKIKRLEGGEAGSNYGGSRRGREDGSTSSR